MVNYTLEPPFYDHFVEMSVNRSTQDLLLASPLHGVQLFKLNVTEFVLGPLLGVVAQGLLRRYEPKSVSGFAAIPAVICICAYTLFSCSVLQSITTVLSFLLV